MKKIIYSLVIMIAAGSLFTSCIDPVEPNGIYDLREAKADYLAALSNLRAADAEVREADAALVNAQAAVQQAIAAEHQAQADWQKLVNELKIAQNDKEKAELQAAIDSIEAKAAQDAVTAQKTLAEEQQKLAEALKKIAAEAMVLTDAEKAVITRAASDFDAAAKKYEKAFSNWKDNAETYYVSSMNATDYEAALAIAQEDLAKWQSELATFQSMDNEPTKWKAVLDQYKAKVDSLEYAKIMLDEGRAMEYLDARDAFAALVEYAQGLVKELGTNPSEDPLTALVEYKDNQLVYDAIEVLVKKVTASANANNWKFGEGVMGFDGMTLDKVEEILFGNKEEGGVDSLGLVGIVDILTREGIITNADYAKLAGQADTLKLEIDSVYAAHKAILEKGVAEFDTVKKANDKHTRDTGALSVAKKVDAYKNYNNPTYGFSDKTDTTNIVNAVAGAKTAYENAAKELFKKVVELLNNGFAEKTIDDTTSFINKLNALGEAQIAMGFGADSVAYYKFNIEKSPVPFDTLYKTIDKITKEDLVIKQASGNLVYSVLGGNGKGINSSVASYMAGYSEFAYPQANGNNGSLFSGKAVQASADAFIRVVNAVLNGNIVDYDDARLSNEASANAELLAALRKNLKITAASGNTTKADTVNYAKNHKAQFTDYTTLENNKKAYDKQKHIVDSIDTEVKKYDAAIKGAYKEFYKVYDAFWGYPEGTHYDASANAYVAISDSLKVNWTEKTFEGILTVAPNLTGTSGNAFAFNQKLDDIDDAFESMTVVSGNAALAAVLDALRARADHAYKYADFLNPENSHIIKGQVISGNARPTEFVQTLYAGWLKEYYNNYTENQEAVAQFKENVNALVAAYDAQVSANATAQAAYDEAKAAIIGEESSANAVAIWGFIENVALANPTNGYNAITNQLSGCATQADLAEYIGTGTFAAKANEIIGKFVLGDLARKAAENKINKEIDDIESVVAQLAIVYNSALQFQYDKEIASGNASGDASTNAKTYIDNYNALIADIEAKIDDAKEDIKDAQDALALLAAGYSAEDVTAKYYAAQLARYEQALADAKAELDFYRAQYEAVMKKFFGQNN